MAAFGMLNWAIVLAFLGMNLLIGWRFSKTIGSAREFHVGSPKTPWWAVGLSVMATYVSALSFLGAPAWAYKDGMAALAIHLNYPLVIILVISFFIPFFYLSGVASIYDYQEKRFGPAARVTSALIFLATQGLSTAAILYATALVIRFMTGLDVASAIVIVTVLALIYTAMGGMLAVIWTDVFQSIILLIGAFVIMAALLAAAPMPVGETLAALKSAGRLNAIDTSFDFTKATTIWAGLLAMTVFHVTVYGGNQMMVQRTLGARTLSDAKKSYILMGFMAFPIYFLFFFIGVLAWGHYSGRPFDNPNEIILIFAGESGIPGLPGILAAAVLAASMSTLSSAFNSMATVTTIDLWRRFWTTNHDDQVELRTTRWFTIMWALIIIIPALGYTRSEGSILETLSKIGSLFVGAKLAMFVLGFFSRRMTERALLVGVVAGFAALGYVATQTPIAWPWYAVIGSTINILVSLAFNLCFDPPVTRWPDWSVPGLAHAPISKDRAHELHIHPPGRLDPWTRLLATYLVATLFILFLINQFI